MEQQELKSDNGLCLGAFNRKSECVHLQQAKWALIWKASVLHSANNPKGRVRSLYGCFSSMLWIIWFITTVVCLTLALSFINTFFLFLFLFIAGYLAPRQTDVAGVPAVFRFMENKSLVYWRAAKGQTIHICTRAYTFREAPSLPLVHVVGRKLENPERIHTDTVRTCNLHASKVPRPGDKAHNHLAEKQQHFATVSPGNYEKTSSLIHLWCIWHSFDFFFLNGLFVFRIYHLVIMIPSI